MALELNIPSLLRLLRRLTNAKIFIVLKLYRHIARMEKLSLMQLWILGLVTAFFAVIARLGNELFRIDINKPEDAVAAKHWERRRLYWAMAELMALPVFPTIAVSITLYFKLDSIAAILISLGLGLLGVGFILHATKFLVNRKLELPQ